MQKCQIRREVTNLSGISYNIMWQFTIKNMKNIYEKDELFLFLFFPHNVSGKQHRSQYVLLGQFK